MTKGNLFTAAGLLGIPIVLAVLLVAGIAAFNELGKLINQEGVLEGINDLDEP